MLEVLLIYKSCLMNGAAGRTTNNLKSLKKLEKVLDKRNKLC